MPSIITHHIFAERILKKIDKNIKELFIQEKDIYLTFAQSHDYLFYYVFDIKKGKEIRNLGHYAHKNKTQQYFLNIIKYIKDNNLQQNEQALAYLYGSLTHYILDTTCHPYIFYKTGTYNTDDKNTNKYHGEHTHIEKDLDSIYYKKEYNKEYKYCNVSKEIIKKTTFSHILNNIIDFAYEKTYNKQHISTYYNKSIKHARIIYSLVVNDRLGLKRLLYKIIDKITNRKFGYLEGYSTHLKPNMNFLNNEKKIWNHPCIKEEKYNYSFDDLLKLSEEKCINIIEEIHNYLTNNNDRISIENVIPNLSYSTGLDLDKNKVMQYFEY